MVNFLSKKFAAAFLYAAQKEMFVLKTKRIVSLVMAVVMMMAILPVVSCAEDEGLLSLGELRQSYGAFTVEAYNIGYGFVVEPTLYLKEGKSTGDITVDVLENKNIAYRGNITNKILTPLQSLISCFLEPPMNR